MKYYDGTKLLSLKDINGNAPEIFICTSNRSAGKTTYFNRYLLNRFKNKGEKFILLYRYKYELSDCYEKFFKSIQQLFFKNDEMTGVKKCNGLYYELIFNDVLCGYAIALNCADGLKKYSHVFSECTRMLFDEFQPETQSYCADEIKKFISIHTTIARGGGSQSRYFPVIMLSNNVSLLNPYFIALGISDRLDSKTAFLRGNGYVLEKNYNEAANTAMSNSSFLSAFSDCDTQIDYIKGKSFLYDDNAFCENVKGKNKYLFTFKYDNKEFAIREFEKDNLLYCDTNIDTNFKIKISISASEHDVNYIMKNQYNYLILTLRQYFENGKFRFKNQICKKAVIELLKY